MLCLVKHNIYRKRLFHQNAAPHPSPSPLPPELVPQTLKLPGDLIYIERQLLVICNEMLKWFAVVICIKLNENQRELIAMIWNRATHRIVDLFPYF